jgi:hypothetical protein
MVGQKDCPCLTKANSAEWIDVNCIHYIYYYLTVILDKLQVILKLKSKHIGGALSKNSKSRFNSLQISLFISQQSIPGNAPWIRILTWCLKILTGVVYGVYSEPPEWTEPGKGSPETCCFGLSTAQGLIEFKCESSTSKHNWVHGVKNLLQQVDIADQVGHKLETLKLNWCS